MYIQKVVDPIIPWTDRLSCHKVGAHGRLCRCLPQWCWVGGLSTHQTGNVTCSRAISSFRKYMYIYIYIALTNGIIVELPGYILIFALVLKGQIQPKLQLWLKQLSKQSGCQRISSFHNMYIVIARWSIAWCVATPDPGLQSEATRATWAKTPEAILCQFFLMNCVGTLRLMILIDFARCNRRSVLGCKPVLWMFF